MLWLAQVLLSMQRLVNALGTASPSCYPVLIPMMQVCTDPNQVLCQTVLVD